MMMESMAMLAMKTDFVWNQMYRCTTTIERIAKFRSPAFQPNVSAIRGWG